MKREKSRGSVYFAADQAEAAAIVTHLAFMGVGATMDEHRCPRVTVPSWPQERLNVLVDALRREPAP